MPGKLEPRSNLLYGWGYGENGWNTGMDHNLLLIGRVGFHPVVKSRAVADPTTLSPAPEAGDGYLVAEAALDAWEGRDNNLAIWSGEAWEFYEPRSGYSVLIEDEGLRTTFLNGAWTTGVAV